LLTEADYKRLVAAAEKSGDIRAKALFESMYYSGMRVSEALQLRVDHVQKGLKVIEDIKGKGSKYRDIYMSDKLIKSLREYLEVRQQPHSVGNNILRKSFFMLISWT
jgi:integrase/recombinase XerD